MHPINPSCGSARRGGDESLASRLKPLETAALGVESSVVLRIGLAYSFGFALTNLALSRAAA